MLKHLCLAPAACVLLFTCHPTSLYKRFGSLDGILASRHALKPFGAAHKLLGQDQPGADARCATATANLAVLRMRPEQQKLLVGRLQESYSQAVARMGQGGSSAQLPSLPRQHQQQPQQQDSLSLLHPARRLHVKQCEPFLATLQECLLQLGWSQQHPNWTGPSGLWCDLVVCAPLEAPSTAAGAAGGAEGGGGGDAAAAAAAAGDDAGGVGQTSSSSTRSSSRSGSSSRLAFQILGPADLSAGESCCRAEVVKAQSSYHCMAMAVTVSSCASSHVMPFVHP